MIDSRIKTFLTLCRLMNYRKVAEELNMTQPGVTQHIHFLEDRYACKFFVYDHHTLRMTEEAEIFKEYAENILYQENKIRQKLKNKKGYKLIIGATKTIGECVIQKKCQAFLKEKSNTLCVEVNNTENLLKQLEEGKLDFALVEGLFDRIKFKNRLYKKENFTGICKKNHPFANKRVSIEEVIKEHLFLREEGSGTREIFKNILIQKNHSLSEFKNTTVAGSFQLLISLLKSTNGITFAYKSVLSLYTGLCEFNIDGVDNEHEFNYVYLDTPFSKEAVEIFDSF